MKKKILLIILLSAIILSGCTKETKKEDKRLVEINGMISYTIDGEKTDIKPTKEEGYIVNKIICDNESDIMWDNDNWEVELTKVNSKDRCKVDFTKDANKEGYRITVTSNNTSSLDSLSKATTKNGTVIIYSKMNIKEVTGCNSTIEDNKVIINNVNSNQRCNIEIEDKTLAGIIKAVYNADDNRKRTDFSVIDNETHIDTPSSLTGGLYVAEDDQGTTYYFSGDGTSMNNWVSFAESMWRIIRINGNGSIRLLYAGTGGEDAYISTNTYSINNSTYSHPSYVGWKYTLGGNLNADRENSTASGAYNVVNSWYTTNITNSGLAKYIDTNAIYCNDRNIGSGSYSTNSKFYYEAYTRLNTNKMPTFKCKDDNDRFTTFGLMLADEISYAGGVYGTNSPKAYYYLNKEGGSSTGTAWWWTMTPNRWNSSDKFALVLIVDGQGYNKGRLNETYVGNDSGVIRPVISLKPEVLVTKGDGSASSPYEVTLP